MADVLQRALDPRVAPRRVLLRHPHDQAGGSRQDAAPTGPCSAYVHFRAISWRCHRSSVSGVTIVAISRNAARPTRYARTASRRRSSSRKRSRCFPKLAPQEPVLLDQVGDRLPLPAVQPAGQHAQHHLQRRGVDHERGAYITGRPERRRPRNGTLRGPSPTVFVTPFPATAAKYQIAKNAFSPVWSRNGKELFFALSGGVSNRLNGVNVTKQPTFAFSPPTAFEFTGQSPNQTLGRNYDVLPDGRFIFLASPSNQPGPPAANPSIQVVLNWQEELKQRVPVK